MSTEALIVVSAIVLWFAHGWYLNERLDRVHAKLDRLMESFDGLRDYLYEIDPQFDDERESRRAFEKNESMFAGMNDMELLLQKEASGKRTLTTRF
jgi:hypothetical protein